MTRHAERNPSRADRSGLEGCWEKTFLSGLEIAHQITAPGQGTSAGGWNPLHLAKLGCILLHPRRCADVSGAKQQAEGQGWDHRREKRTPQKEIHSTVAL